MKRKQKLSIGIGIAVVTVFVAVWILVSIEGRKVRGQILVRDAETKQPVVSALVLFEVSRTPTKVYPPTQAGFVSASRTDEQGSIQVPDLSGSNWASATYFRVYVLADGYKKYARELPRNRFGKNGVDCRALKTKLVRKM